MKHPVLTVIIPAYEESENLTTALAEISATLQSASILHRFLIVDDGSQDDTWSVIQKLKNQYSELVAVRFSRNFGKEAAICAGLDAARTEICAVMDADLQHPPELLPLMVEKWKEGFEVVEGVKASRGKESFLYGLCAGAFYRVIRKLSGLELEGSSDFQLLDRRAIEAWRSMQEHTTFFRGMSDWVGFRRAQIPFHVKPRTGGRSKFSTMRLIKLALDAVTSFSSLPLQFVTFLGTVFLIGAFLLGIQTLYMYFSGHAVSGFTTVILLLLIVGSAIMISLGILGTYLARVFDEVKLRPRYVVAELIGVP